MVCNTSASVQSICILIVDYPWTIGLNYTLFIKIIKKLNHDGKKLKTVSNSAIGTRLEKNNFVLYPQVLYQRWYSKPV